MEEKEWFYKGHLITRSPFTGWYYALTKNGRILACTLAGAKKMINSNL